MIESIKHLGRQIAIIIRNSFYSDGIEFFTPDDYSQQLGYMNRPKDYVIPPHVHNSVPREVYFTKEVLFIKSGKLRVDFYDDDQNYLESRILERGDVFIGFWWSWLQMLETTELLRLSKVLMLVMLIKHVSSQLT